MQRFHCNTRVSVGPEYTFWIKSDKSTELGYSSEAPKLSLEERRKAGAYLEERLKGEKDAAKAPVT